MWTLNNVEIDVNGLIWICIRGDCRKIRETLNTVGLRSKKINPNTNQQCWPDVRPLSWSDRKGQILEAVPVRYADAVFCILMRATIVIAYVNIFSGVSIFRTPVCAVFRVLKPHRTTAAACDVSLLVGVDVYRQYASFFFMDYKLHAESLNYRCHLALWVYCSDQTVPHHEFESDLKWRCWFNLRCLMKKREDREVEKCSKGSLGGMFCSVCISPVDKT